jgi:hypothetical protein
MARTCLEQLESEEGREDVSRAAGRSSRESAGAGRETAPPDVTGLTSHDVGLLTRVRSPSQARAL